MLFFIEVFVKYLVLALSLFFVFCESKKDIEQYRVNYDSPYYGMAFGSGVFLYSEPSLDSEALYRLSPHQILEFHASVSLRDPSVLWYWVQEERSSHSGRKKQTRKKQSGYVEARKIRIFETLKQAKDFITHSVSGN